MKVQVATRSSIIGINIEKFINYDKLVQFIGVYDWNHLI